MHIIVWVLGAVSGFILWNKIKWLAILVIILAISYSVNPLEQKRFKEKGSYDNITATRLGVTFALVIGIFIFSLFKININKNISDNNTNNDNSYSFEYTDSYNTQKIQDNSYIQNNINNAPKTVKKECPEDYLLEEEQNKELDKYISDYMIKFPNATIVDFLNSRYSYLVDNNCSQTLEYIKNQANGEDPRTYYIRKNAEDFNGIKQQ